MPTMHGPWMTLAIALPLATASVVALCRDTSWRWWLSTLATAATMVLAGTAWLELNLLGVWAAADFGDPFQQLFGATPLAIDGFAGPLIPLASALHFFVILVTPRSKRTRFPFALTLVSLAILLAMFSTRWPVVIIGLFACQSLLPYIELRRRKQPWRFFAWHQVAGVVCLTFGWLMVDNAHPTSAVSLWGTWAMAVGLLVRCGCVPMHCWLVDLFDRASLGTALLFVAPMVGAYGLVRLVLPIAPEFVLQGIALASLVTALYAACMTLVQTSTRRFFCYLFLSNSALLLIGLESLTAVGLTGSLCLWLSIGIALTSFGIIIRALEGRVGRMPLDRFHGLYGQMPLLAGFFLLALLASIGFPGTVGFVGAELLIEGAIDAYSYSGMLVVAAMAMNGIGALRAYFRLFTGTPAPAAISMQPRLAERLAIWGFSAAIIVGGVYPQPGVTTRHRAVEMLMRMRESNREAIESKKAAWPYYDEADNHG